MNIFNTSKITLVVLFAINAINSQSFASDVKQERSFLTPIKVAFMAATIAVTSSLVTSPADAIKVDYQSCDQICVGQLCSRKEKEKATNCMRLLETKMRKEKYQERSEDDFFKI